MTHDDDIIFYILVGICLAEEIRKVANTGEELKHLDGGCEALVDGIISPEVPKTRKSGGGRFAGAGGGWPSADIKGNGGMISRIRALVSF